MIRTRRDRIKRFKLSLVQSISDVLRRRGSSNTERRELETCPEQLWMPPAWKRLAGWGLGQLHLAGGIPAHGRGVELGEL